MSEPNRPLTSLEPMGSADASRLVNRFLSCFPNLSLANPDYYIAQMCVLFAGYPLWAGERAVGQAQLSFKFPPSLAELRPILEDQVAAARYAKKWEHEGRKQLEGPPENPRPSYDELKARYGEDWGIDSGKRKPPPPKTEAELKAMWADFCADKSYGLHLEELAKAHPRMRGEV